MKRKQFAFGPELSAFIAEYSPCSDAIEAMQKAKITTLKAAWKWCPRADWMLWALRRLPSQPPKEKFAALAILLAKQFLPTFEKKYRGDKRPRQAIVAAKACLADSSEINLQVARVARVAAYDAAYAAALVDTYETHYGHAAALASVAAYIAGNTPPPAYVLALVDEEHNQKQVADLVRKMFKNPFA